MKQKNNDSSERLRRRIPVIVSSIVLYGFFLLIAVQSIPLVITYREVAQFVSLVMLTCGLLIPVGIAGWQIAIHKIPNLLINLVEIPNVGIQTPPYQMTDDGEIIEITDDQMRMNMRSALITASLISLALPMECSIWLFISTLVGNQSSIQSILFVMAMGVMMYTVLQAVRWSPRKRKFAPPIEMNGNEVTNQIGNVLGDDGEIIEVTDDQEPKRGGDSAVQ